MSRTYRAVLHGDHLEWIDAPPPPSSGLPVEVTVIEGAGEPGPRRGKAMARALEALARAGGIAAIPDPLEWQREVRQDRALPGWGE